MQPVPFTAFPDFAAAGGLLWWLTHLQVHEEEEESSSACQEPSIHLNLTWVSV